MPDLPPHPDDNLMDRFDRDGARRFGAREALLAIGITALLLVLCAGGSVKRAGEQMSPGLGRDVVLAVGRPSAWLASQLPLHDAAHSLTAWLSPDAGLPQGGSFVASAAAPATAAGIPPVTPDAFDPADLGRTRTPERTLHRLLVTGDSMSQPLDQDLARRLVGQGITVTRDPHIGTGISKSILLDWGRLSTQQVAQFHPDAVVIFIGANDGFSMPDAHGRPVACCSAAWAAIYAARVRQMMSTYRRDGASEVYWLTLPAPREAARREIARVVNAAIEVAAEPWRSDVRVIDTVPVFTPGLVYRDSMGIAGTPTLVRQPDGIHLNDAGSALLAQLLIAAIGQDFHRPGSRTL